MSEASLSFDNHTSLPFPISSKPCCFLMICVLVDDFRKPHSVNVLFRKGIQGCVVFQILLGCSVLLPSQSDGELDFDGIIFLLIH